MTGPPDDGSVSRWVAAGRTDRGAEYDAKWAVLEAAGASIHGEADLVASLGPRSVLDAGCGTGRVAIELARRGLDVVGTDLDPSMLAAARAKAPELTWIEGDLATVRLGRRFDVVVMAGNVMIFVRPGSETAVVANLVDHLEPDGRLVAGFQRTDHYDADRYDADCAAAGLVPVDRFATWSGDPWVPGGGYAVSIHAAPG